MNYIVFDLEWNQAPAGRARPNPKLPFEILEIGAVKLNSRLKTVSEFHETIKPLVYREMNKQTQKIVHLDMNELKNSKTFSPAARHFLEWCGEDPMFVTWGPSDLFELQRNLEYYKIRYDFPKPLLYYDLQKLYSLALMDGKKRPALQEAVEALEIPETKPFHGAFEDAWYTAEVMKKLNLKPVLEYKSVDYYRLPETREEEVYLHFKTYDKYVSVPFDTKEDALNDKTVTAIRCPKCGLPVIHRMKWFASATGNMYYALIQCPLHGNVKGKIRIRKTRGEKIFIVKTIKPATEKDVEELKARKEAVREKRHKRLEKERAARKRKKAAARATAYSSKES